MSTTIDHRVIQMKFDNDEFEKRASKTLNTLADLKSKMNFDGAKKGLTELSAVSKGFTLDHIGQGVEELKNKFSALNIIGITALTNIANKAINAGTALVKSLTIGPISEGFNDYNTKLTSVQTIMNATGADIRTVNGYFNQLDAYADKTIYNLSDMTGAFAKFTNAGLDMDKSVPAIKGIANMVALAGQDANAASIAMYNLSQSIAGGFLTTTDYKSLNLANVATKEWKDQMIAGAMAAGTLKKSSKGIYNIPGSKKAYTDASLFTEGLAEQWATTQVLTKVLGDYGDTTTDIGKKAQAAAQNVKSLPMMMETLKASVGTGWTTAFEFILGNVEESTKLFTGMTNAIQSVLDKSAQSRNHMLHQWKDLGGRTAIIDSVRNAWNALGAVMKPIGEAWRSVFPSGGMGVALAKLSFQIREFTSHLIIGGETAENLKKTFQGVFSLFKIGTTIIGGLLRGVFGLFGIIGSGGGGALSSLLSITAVLGQFLTKIQEMLVESGAIKTFFTVFLSPLSLIKPLIGFVIQLADAFIALAKGDVSAFTSKFHDAFGGLGAVLEAIQNKVSGFVDLFVLGLTAVSGYLASFASNVRRGGGAVANMFGNWAQAVSDFLSNLGGGALDKTAAVVNKLSGAFEKLQDAMTFDAKLGSLDATAGSLTKLGAVAASLGSVWRGVVSAFTSVGHALEPITSALRDFFSTLITKLTDFIKGMDMQDALAVVNTTFFILLYRMFTKFLGDMRGLVQSMNQMFDNIGGIFGQLTDTLKAMQRDIQAKTILKIAAAVAILTASVFTLSKIDPKALAIALGAMTTMFIQLGLALKYMSFDQKGLFSTGTGLVLLAVAIKLMAGAVADIAKIDTVSLIKGLVALGVMLAGLTLFTKFAELDNGGVKAGAGLVLLAVAIRILVGAVETLGKLDVKELAKGIGALMILLSMLVAASLALETVLPGARAMVILAGALAILAPVLTLLGFLPYEVLGKGLFTIAAALTILAIAANAMTTALPGAGAIAIMAASLLILTPVLVTLGQLAWGTIFKGLVTIAAALTILAIAANAMTTALPGAAAIVIMAAALAILAPVLILFGQMSWESIAKGLVALAGTLLILVAAAYALTPVLIIFTALSTSIVILGAGLLLAGLGMLAFSAALAALAVSGAAGFAVLMLGIQSFLAMLPLIAQQFGLALVAFAKVIAVAAPKLIAAFTAIVIAFLKSIQQTGPELIRTIGIILEAFLKEIVKRGPQIFAAGLDLIIGLLKAIRSRIAEMTNVAIDIVTIFIDTLRKRLGPIIEAGVNFIITFLNGIAKAIDEHGDEIAEAGLNIAEAMINGMIRGLGNLRDRLMGVVRDAIDRLPDIAKKVLGINSPSKVFEKIGEYSVLGLANGFKNSAPLAEHAAGDIGDHVINALKETISGMDDLVPLNMDLQPKITPILDLSTVKKDAALLGGILPSGSIDVEAAYARARAANASYTANQEMATEVDSEERMGGDVIFNQTINSPKAISTAEVYRNTNNQISKAKGALTGAKPS